MTSRPCALLHPEDRKSQNQQHQEDHQEDVEQDAGDVGGRCRDAGKSQYAGDDRDHEEKQPPFQQSHGPVLQASRRIGASVSLTMRFGTGSQLARSVVRCDPNTISDAIRMKEGVSRPRCYAARMATSRNEPGGGSMVISVTQSAAAAKVELPAAP